MIPLFGRRFIVCVGKLFLFIYCVNSGYYFSFQADHSLSSLDLGPLGRQAAEGCKSGGWFANFKLVALFEIRDMVGFGSKCRGVTPRRLPRSPPAPVQAADPMEGHSLLYVNVCKVAERLLERQRQVTAPLPLPPPFSCVANRRVTCRPESGEKAGPRVAIFF